MTDPATPQLVADRASEDRLIQLGKVTGVFGVEGMVKLESYTEPRSNLFKYTPWTLKHAGKTWQVDKVRGREHGKTVVGQWSDLNTREQAQALIGAEVWVARSRLPKAKVGEFYWIDLEGLAVSGENGVPLGTVSHLFSTGSNDVLVVVDGERERMIPFLLDSVVKKVDLDAGLIETDWDPEF